MMDSRKKTSFKKQSNDEKSIDKIRKDEKKLEKLTRLKKPGKSIRERVFLTPKT